jgi:hypothetical protein
LGRLKIGAQKILNTKHHRFHVRVYNDGNIAVVSYRASQHISIKGKGPMHYDEKTFEVLVKRNGNLRAIDHAVVDKCPKIFADSHQSTFDVSLGPAQNPHFWKNVRR